MESSDLATVRHGSSTGDVEPEDALVGRVIDRRYRIIRRLGHGGMGAVYEAEHLSLESRVAIKILQASLSTNEKYRKRFLREARAASAIDSINIVRSSDFGATDDGLLYFAMELMEGQDLEQHLADVSRMDWPRFEPVLRQVTNAVAAAHKRGVIHRDIKPSNCFLCKTDGWPPLVKVLDFGIAKINASAEHGENPVATLETLTATNELFGTIAYMAPELIEGHPADARSDIYALGVMIFRVLAGRLPFTSPNVYKVLQQHVATPVPSLRALVAEIPAAVESVVFRAMAKQPEHRYQTIAELEAALVAASAGIIEPSAAALSGHTHAVSREHGSTSSPPEEARPPGGGGDPALAITAPNAPGVSPRIDDASSLASARIRAPRFSRLATIILALAVAGGVGAAAFSFVDSRQSEPSAPEMAAEREPAPQPLPPRATEANPAVSRTETKVTEEPSKAPSSENVPPAVVPESSSEAPKPSPSARKKQLETRKASSPASKPRTLDDLAGDRCPDAVGERFTIEGVLNAQGKYIDPDVTGGTKGSRACIDAFIRTRGFGVCRSMEPHTEQLNPR